MSDFVERLKVEVDRHGGVAVVAAHLSVARNTIYNWIAKGNVPLNELMRLKDFGFDLNYIISGVRGRPAEQDVVEYKNPREQALIENYYASDEEGKRAMELTSAALAKQKRKA